MMKTLMSICTVTAVMFSGMSASGDVINFGNASVADLYGGNFFRENPAETSPPLSRWNLTQSDLTFSMTLDLSDADLDAGGVYVSFGMRNFDSAGNVIVSGSGDWFGPEGGGGWGEAFYAYAPDANSNGTQSIHDKIHLKRNRHGGDGDYNVLSDGTITSDFGNTDNYGLWFDRDGVDQWQAQNPLNVDGATYNTGGIYEIEITYHAIDETQGTMFMTVNGIAQGFDTDDNGDYDTMPAGMTFTGDMTDLSPFVARGGWGNPNDGTPGTVYFNDVTVEGTLVPEPATLGFFALGALGCLLRRRRA